MVPAVERGLPSVRDVHLRPRPDGSAAAARVAALLPPRAGGWVPPPDSVPFEHLVPDDDDRDGGVGPAPSTAPLSSPVPDLDDATAAPGRSWGARAPGVHLAAGARYRLDPGRRGAIALVLVALLAALVAGAFALRDRPQEVALPAVEAVGVPLPGTSPTAATGGEVVVAVAGKVGRPGLLRLPAGSRVDDAVRAAGGATPGADLTLLNLARRLVDGEQVLVGVPGAAAGPVSGAGGLLDLNAASASDLDALPGIGPVLAQRIVDWRTENGRFASVDQLREVTGIGEAKYADLEPKVTV